MRTTHCAIIVAACLTAACAGSPVQAGLPAEDVEAIRQLQSQFIAVCQRSAWTELPPFFTDDAALIHANAPVVNGIEAIREHYQALQLRAVEVDAVPTLIDGTARWAYLRGISDGIFQVGSSEPARDRGAFIWILRKQDNGAWKIAESLSVPLGATP
jgi:ketosteroid isomerase-like protein